MSTEPQWCPIRQTWCFCKPRCDEYDEDAVNAYANAMVKRDQLQRDIGRPEHDRTTWGETIDESKVRKRKEGIL